MDHVRYYENRVYVPQLDESDKGDINIAIPYSILFSILFRGLSMGFIIKKSGLMQQPDGKPQVDDKPLGSKFA